MVAIDINGCHASHLCAKRQCLRHTLHKLKTGKKVFLAKGLVSEENILVSEEGISEYIYFPIPDRHC